MLTHAQPSRQAIAPPVTPDGRYFVVRGRLWRCSNPALAPEIRDHLVEDLMTARRAKGKAMKAGAHAARESARGAVDRAKHALGERGPVWWTDGAPDWNRHLRRTLPTPPGSRSSPKPREHLTEEDKRVYEDFGSMNAWVLVGGCN